MLSKKMLAGAAVVFFFVLAFCAKLSAMETLTDLDALKDKAGRGKVVAVVFTADWCKWCKPFEENIFMPLANSYQNNRNVEFYAFDLTEQSVAKTVTQELDFNAIPTVIVFSGDFDERDTFIAPKDPQTLRDAINGRL